MNAVEAVIVGAVMAGLVAGGEIPLWWIPGCLVILGIGIVIRKGWS